MFPRFTRERRLHPSRRMRRPTLETLEGKQLLSLGPQMVGTVNTTTRNAQFASDNATNAGGESVVVWTDVYNGSDWDIRAQRYNSFGGKIGPENIVAYTTLQESDPSVAIDGQGRFVVTYMQQVGTDTNVLAQRFDSNGNILGAPVQVGAGTFREHNADVAMNDQGGFVVSYTRDTNNNNPDVFAKRYDVNGNLLQVINVATTGVSEGNSSVAMTPDGRFDVAWEQEYSTYDHDIYVSSFSASGLRTTTYTVAFTTAYDTTPSISVDTFGDAVVAWASNYDIMARRISAAGSMGSVINITGATPSSTDQLPAVALNKQGGGFVVTYFSSSVVTGNSSSVAEVSSADHVTTYNIGAAFELAVSMDAFGDYFVTYDTYETNPNTTGNTDIHARHGYLPF